MIYIGVDESGTGAWAGPFCVAAVVARDVESVLFRSRGVRDSKVLSDRRRRVLFDTVVVYALGVQWEEVSVATRDSGQQAAWQKAVVAVVRRAIEQTKSFLDSDEGFAVVVDGKRDPVVKSSLEFTKHIRVVQFIPRADATVPCVSAASVVAKTVRNDSMLRLHKEYPEYHWNDNYGYGTRSHMIALGQYGAVRHHRDVKPIRKVRAHGSTHEV